MTDIDTLECILTQLEEEKSGLDEHMISQRIKDAFKHEGRELSPQAFFEVLAFDFSEHESKTVSPYFLPVVVGVRDDGSKAEYPDSNTLERSCVEYWSDRASKTKNPLLKARYAGLVWEFSKKVLGSKPIITFAEDHILCSIEASTKGYFKHNFYGIKKLERALRLSLSLNKMDLVAKCKDALFEFEQLYAIDDKAGLWGFNFDLFILERPDLISQTEQEALLKDLEDRLGRLIASKTPNDWAVESAVERLANFYHSKKDSSNVERVLLVLENFMTESVVGKPAMNQSHCFMRLHELYKIFGFSSRSEEMLNKANALGKQINKEMKTISASFNLTDDQINEFKNAMSQGDLRTSLRRIAVYFIPSKKTTEEQIQNIASKSPLTFMLQKHIQSFDGRNVAVIGALKDDLDGHIINHLSQDLSLRSVFLRMAFEQLIAVFGLDTELLTGHLFESSAFPEENRSVIKMGVKAFFEGRHYEAAAVLIPQIEAILRHILTMAGGYVLSSEPNREGGFNYKMLGAIISDEKIKNMFGVRGEDVQTYLRVVLTDNRGWNLRNDFCHGVALERSFSQLTSDRLIHILLLFSLFRDDSPSA